MKKIVLASVFLFGLIVLIATSVFANSINLIVNDKKIKLDQAPIIENNRTLVPIRFIAEELGASIDWNPALRKVLVTLDSTKIELTIDSKTAVVNGKNTALDVPAKIVGSRTLVPVRFIAESLNTSVYWEDFSRSIYIYSRNTDAIFSNHDAIDQLTTLSFYIPDVLNKRLVFRESKEDPTRYTLEGKVNPKIDKQVYEVTKALIGEGGYTYTGLAQDDSGRRVVIKYAQGAGFAFNDNNLFTWIFYDEKLYNAKLDSQISTFSEKAFMSIRVGALWSEFPVTRWAQPIHEHRLKSAFVGMLGEKEGNEVHQFVMSEYMKKKTTDYNNHHKTVLFETVRVDFYTENDGGVNFNFSYK